VGHWLAFISANLGAVEIIWMSTKGAEYGMPIMHYYWIWCHPDDAVPGVW
jgi:SSS family solute:Na+ symporter